MRDFSSCEQMIKGFSQGQEPSHYERGGLLLNRRGGGGLVGELVPVTAVSERTMIKSKMTGAMHHTIPNNTGQMSVGNSPLVH